MPRGGWNLTKFSAEQIERMSGPESHADLARAFGMSDMPIRRWRTKNRWERSTEAAVPQAAEQAPVAVAGRKDSADESVVTSPPVLAADVRAAGGAEAYLRTYWDFPASDWHCVSATGNQWEGPRAGGAVVTYAQVKGTFRPIKALVNIIPRPAEWTGPTFETWPAPKPLAAHQIVVVADDQAPYHDEALHRATCSMLRALQPARICHIGDLCDYTNISKHKDHQVVKAAVDECTDAGVAILAAMRAAAPYAHFQILPGNHDIRPFSELLLRAERMSGIHCGRLPGEAEAPPVLDMRRLWRLDDLGIEYVEDERGWEHAELDLVPGPRGLAAVHGWLTGNNVAARTLDAVGRSVVMGHTHRPEIVYQWNNTLGFEMRAMVIGAQCEVRGGGGKRFPTFVPRDGWLQGGALVSVYGDGEWEVERMRWNGESLFANGERFTA